MPLLLNLLTVGVLFVSMLVVQEVGRGAGRRDRQGATDPSRLESGAAEGVVYGLLGLLIAFTFSGAAARYESRQNLIVEESNAIGTSWLLIDLLPASAQPPLRDRVRRYVEVRIEDSRTAWGTDGTARSVRLQSDIWSTATAGARASGEDAPPSVLLPALNEMFKIRTMRERGKSLHPPVGVFVMLAVLVLIASLFAGYDSAVKPRHWTRTLGFAAVLSLSLFVIIDYEFPNFGLIRINADSMLVDLRRSMD